MVTDYPFCSQVSLFGDLHTLQRQEKEVGNHEFSRGSQTQSFYSNTVNKQPSVFTWVTWKTAYKSEL